GLVEAAFALVAALLDTIAQLGTVRVVTRAGVHRSAILGARRASSGPGRNVRPLVARGTGLFRRAGRLRRRLAAARSVVLRARRGAHPLRRGVRARGVAGGYGAAAHRRAGAARRGVTAHARVAGSRRVVAARRSAGATRR